MSLRRCIVSLLVVLALLPLSPARAQPACTFTLGFKLLHDQIPDTVGSCLEDEHFEPSTGNTLQRTAGGLLVWRRADNWTAFTDGLTTYISGPQGLASRPNSGPLFPWESPAPATVAVPAPTTAPASPARTPLRAADYLASDGEMRDRGYVPIPSAESSSPDGAYLQRGFAALDGKTQIGFSALVTADPGTASAAFPGLVGTFVSAGWTFKDSADRRDGEDALSGQLVERGPTQGVMCLPPSGFTFCFPVSTSQIAGLSGLRRIGAIIGLTVLLGTPDGIKAKVETANAISTDLANRARQYPDGYR